MKTKYKHTEKELHTAIGVTKEDLEKLKTISQEFVNDYKETYKNKAHTPTLSRHSELIEFLELFMLKMEEENIPRSLRIQGLIVTYKSLLTTTPAGRADFLKITKNHIKNLTREILGEDDE